MIEEDHPVWDYLKTPDVNDTAAAIIYLADMLHHDYLMLKILLKDLKEDKP